MSAIRKRSISLRGHRTSYSIENEFFAALQQMAALRKIPLAQIVSEIDAARGEKSNLSSALRIAVLVHVQSGSASTETFMAMQTQFP